ncbi:MAG: C39 family peptidase [Candidatus Altiarchaeia archaeon]
MMCIPACVKTVIDNQFNYKISLRKIIEATSDRLDKYNAYVPKGLDDIQSSLQKLLENHVIAVTEDINVSKNKLLETIVSGCYPIVILNTEEYYLSKGIKAKGDPDVIGYHAVVVVGYNEDKEEICIWDPEDNASKKTYDYKAMRKIDYKAFLSAWSKSKSRMICLTQKSKQTRISPYL